MEFKLSDIDMLSSATKAFVNHDESLKELFGDSHPFYSVEAAIEGKKDFAAEKRTILVNELKKQYQAVFGQLSASDLTTAGSNGSPDDMVKANIELLSQANTFTISTGQQLHLFLGPAFVLYKIIATIKAAEHYKRLYPEFNFVPIYWLASEDHDFEEIKSTRVFQQQFDWETAQGGATGRFHVTEVAKIIEDIRQKLTLNPENIALLAEFEKIYTSSSNLSEASRRIAHHLFGKYGLVCIDGDNKALKTLFIPQIKQEILEQENIRKFNGFSDRLSAMGLSLQLKGRDINIFYLTQNKRSRITLKEDRYHVLETDIVFSKEELLNDIEAHPENYSPNALLRPVYEEAILPNICYIGGNAEVNYWLQLKDVFPYNNITPPFLALRPSIWIVPVKVSSWMEKYAIDPLQLLKAKTPKDLLNLLDRNDDHLKEKTHEFNALRQEIQDLAAAGETRLLKDLVEHGKLYEKLLKKLESEISEKRISRMETDFKKLESIKLSYHDLHHIQERNTSTLELLIKYDSLEFQLHNSLEFKASAGKILIL